MYDNESENKYFCWRFTAELKESKKENDENTNTMNGKAENGGNNSG